MKREKRKGRGKQMGMLLIVGSLLLSGCGKGKEEVIPIEEANNLNLGGTYEQGTVMKGESGYYYNGNSIGNLMDLHYFDNESKQNVFLCSKPECQHQGDEFCTATSNDYFLKGNLLYGGKIYYLTQELTENQHWVLKIVRVETDGSGRTELVTLKDYNLGEQDSYRFAPDPNFIIHRGICMASYTVDVGDHILRGTCIYNLTDGSVSELPEYSFEVNQNTYVITGNQERNRFMVQGDYIYYNEYRPEEKKTFLCRLNITTGETEEAKLQNGYKGRYTVWKEGITAIQDSFGNVHTYDWNTQTFHKGDKINVSKYGEGYDEDGNYVERKEFIYPVNGELFCLNGQLVLIDQYVPGFMNETWIGGYDAERLTDEWGLYMVMLNDNLEIEKEVELKNLLTMYQQDEGFREKVFGEDTSGYFVKSSIVDQDWYVETPDRLYVCPLQGVLEQTEEFTKVYDKEAREIQFYEYSDYGY